MKWFIGKTKLLVLTCINLENILDLNLDFFSFVKFQISPIPLYKKINFNFQLNGTRFILDKVCQMFYEKMWEFLFI
jgi:hypothetical protein